MNQFATCVSEEDRSGGAGLLENSLKNALPTLEARLGRVSSLFKSIEIEFGLLLNHLLFINHFRLNLLLERSKKNILQFYKYLLQMSVVLFHFL